MLAAEPAEPTVMDRAPRRPGKRLLVRNMFCSFGARGLGCDTAGLEMSRDRARCYAMAGLIGS